MATTPTEDGQKQTAKTGTEIQIRRKTEHWTIKKRWRDQLHLEDQETGNEPNPLGT